MTLDVAQSIADRYISRLEGDRYVGMTVETFQPDTHPDMMPTRDVPITTTFTMTGEVYLSTRIIPRERGFFDRGFSSEAEH
jgi:hypothetical protein